MSILENFEKRIKDCDGIVCYGAGQRLQLFADYFKDSEVFHKVLFCVDKNISLQETGVCLHGRLINVFPVKQIQKLKEKNIVLFITNARYDLVLKELRMHSDLRGMEYYCFSHILGEIAEKHALQKKVPSNYKITEEPVIPKIIHYCWFGRNPIPDQYKKWMESWSRYCPDYEIKQWNEDNYDVTQNDFMCQAYQQRKWGFVSDYARLDIIYQYGGIYLDTDVELVQGLDDLLYQKGFAGFEANAMVAFGLGFGAEKGLPIIKKLRDDYNKLQFVADYGKVTCPIIQTESLKKMGLQQTGEYQIVDDLVIYPEKMFAGKNWYSRRTKLTSDTKSIHHYEASWQNEETRKFYESFEKEMNGELPSSVNGLL